MLTWYLNATLTVPAIGSTVTGTFIDTCNMWPGVLVSIEDYSTQSVFDVLSVVSNTSAILINRGYGIRPFIGHVFPVNSVVTSAASPVPIFYDKFTAGDNDPPAASYATFDVINNISTLGFVAASTTGSVFKSILPHFSSLSSGIVVRIKWISVAQTTGTVTWGAAFEPTSLATVNSDHFGTQVLATSTANGVAGVEIETVISIPYSVMGSAVSGNLYRLQVQRLSTDTMTGNAELLSVTTESGSF